MKAFFVFLLPVLLSSNFIYAGNSVFVTDSVSSDSSVISHFLYLFTGKEDNNIPEVQRSRRNQVDQLLKSILEQPGKLQLSGVATLSLQSKLEKQPIYLGAGSFDIFAYTSFGKHALLFFDFEAAGGKGPDALIPNKSGLNGDAAGAIGADSTDRITVLEAWTEFKAVRDIFTVTVGKIDMTNYFDGNLHANDETSQFISGVFVNNPIIPVRSNGPGIVFRTSFLQRFYIQYGLSKVDVFDKNIMRGHLKMLETGFKLFPGSGWESNYRIFGFEHPFAGHSQGFGISTDQLITPKFHLFGRYGKNSSKLGEWHGVYEAWSAGMGFKQHFFNREFKVGFAYAETFTGKPKEPERMVEVYVNNQLNEWVFISPHFQFLKDNSPEKNETFLAGIRLNLMY